MVYESPDCQDFSLKIRPGEGQNLEELDFKNKVSSFHVCNQNDGAGPVRIELFDSRDQKG